jgi:hypothetical protein
LKFAIKLIYVTSVFKYIAMNNDIMKTIFIFADLRTQMRLLCACKLFTSELHKYDPYIKVISKEIIRLSRDRIIFGIAIKVDLGPISITLYPYSTADDRSIFDVRSHSIVRWDSDFDNHYCIWLSGRLMISFVRNIYNLYER